MGLIAAPGACIKCARFPLWAGPLGLVCMCGTPTLADVTEPEADDAPTLSYTVTRTVQITVDVTPDDAIDARERGETCAEYAQAVAELMGPGAWTVVDETVAPA